MHLVFNIQCVCDEANTCTTHYHTDQLKTDIPILRAILQCTIAQALGLCTGRTVHRGSRGIALSFHDHGTRRGEGAASRSGRSLPPGKARYPLYMRLGGPQGRSGQVRKISPPPEFDPRTVQPVASRYTDWATRPTWGTLICDKSRDSDLQPGMRLAYPPVFNDVTCSKTTMFLTLWYAQYALNADGIPFLPVWQLGKSERHVQSLRHQFLS